MKKERLMTLLAYGVVPALALTRTGNASGLAFYTFVVFFLTTAIAVPLTKLVSREVRVTLALIVNVTVVSLFMMLFSAFIPSLITGNEIYFALTGISVVALFLFTEDELPYRIAVRNAVNHAGFYECAIEIGAVFRELLGAGSFCGFAIKAFQPYKISLFMRPFGGFFIYGVMLALADRFISEEDVA